MIKAEQKAFFHECLCTALVTLMAEKPFDKISISELCHKAGVSRMAYYRNYNSKEEILLQHLDECFKGCLAELRQLQPPTVYDVSVKCFTYIEREPLFFREIVNSEFASALMDKIHEYSKDVMTLLMPDLEVPAYIISHFTGGIYKIVVDWIKNGMDVSAAELAELVFRLASINKQML